MKTYTRATPAPWTTLGHRLAAVASTNALLHERAQAAARAGVPLPAGTSLRADHQTAGRGRHARHWEGHARDNLYVSYLLDGAGLPAARLFTLSQALALAVREVVAERAPARDALVKWPNDIFLDGRKVAGLLVEASLSGETPLYVVAGVGLNVNQLAFASAPDATSLRAATGCAFDVQDVWAALTRKLQVGHAELAAAVATGDTYAIARRYHGLLLNFDSWGRYRRERDGATVTARVKGVDADGRLILEHDGDDHRYGMDEIRFRGPVSHS